MEKCKKPNRNRPYNSGVAARRIYGNLRRDLEALAGHHENDVLGLNNDEGILAFRAREQRELGFGPPYWFKAHKQLDGFLKKFRFANDRYTDDELLSMTIEKFIVEQNRLHKPLDLKVSGFRVLQRARKLCARILGEYPGDEIINAVRFGKKSSIGCPLSLAYIDIKLSDERALTGTADTAEYFLEQVLPGDSILSRILSKHNLCATQEKLNYQHLNLIDVPKTWDKYRLITPLTLLGLFFSYGVGRVVQSRLKDAGLDIARLQQRHQRLVKKFSVTCKHATADLSNASDSITSELLNRVLPRPWYRAVRKTFVRRLNVGDERYISTASVLPMGNGATFPLETLIFYCIVKAIGDLSGVKGIYSVYGDDLIYPSKLHKYVVHVFPQMHLVLNGDKTFVKYPFRESCGADFYRGYDVRPYFLKGAAEDLTRVRYEAFLYKVYNGLIARWLVEEIPHTIKWILSELAMLTDRILRVPPSFPDYSGVKVLDIKSVPLNYDFLPWAAIYLQFRGGSRWFQFDFLTETPKKRVVKTTEPYYWLALQGLDDEPDADEYKKFLHSDLQLVPKLMAHLIAGGVSPYDPRREAKRMALSWKRVVVKNTIFRKGKKVIMKRTKNIAVVPSRKGSTVSTATVRTESISDWF